LPTNSDQTEGGKDKMHANDILNCTTIKMSGKTLNKYSPLISHRKACPVDLAPSGTEAELLLLLGQQCELWQIASLLCGLVFSARKWLRLLCSKPGSMNTEHEIDMPSNTSQLLFGSLSAYLFKQDLPPKQNKQQVRPLVLVTIMW